MSERKACIRCERAIDAWSKICPFCNWNQADPAPPADAAPKLIETNYVPEDDVREQLKRKGLFAGVGVLVLIASFLIGMIINSDGAPDDAPEPVTEQQEKVAPVRRADTPLVPTNERGGIEQPITSAPVAASSEGTTTAPGGYDRSDATAVSSVEYNDLAKRAKAERERMSALVDPRSITGAAYAQGRRPAPVRRPATEVASNQPLPPGAQLPPPDLGMPPASQPQQPSAPPQVANTPRPRRNVLRTRPVPQYQPLPRINASGTARLSLIIGADGRVRDINIEKPLSRNTADLIAAVQRWRFKPATENGEPVAAPYSVDINFGGR